MNDPTDHATPSNAENLPSGTMVREHWDNWAWFTRMTKRGIVLVVLIVMVAVYFITR